MLNVSNLESGYGKLQVLKKVSMYIKPGEIVTIIGANGAGKTTLFNVITGKYNATGKIDFMGHNILGFPPHRICHKGIARTFQMPLLFNSMDVVSNIRVGAHFGKVVSHEEERTIEMATAKKIMYGHI